MTQEEKQLLLKDLCTRLPYGVKVKYFDMEYPFGSEPVILTPYLLYNRWENIHDVKPYLRPMSSMTEKEKEDVKPLFKLVWTDDNKKLLVVRQNKMAEYLDYIYSHHFDFRGLIEKSLAMEAPEGMYK